MPQARDKGSVLHAVHHLTEKVPCSGRVACQMMPVGLDGGWESGKSYGVFACLFLRIHVFFRQEAVPIGLS